ncbi:hypothetical protein THRCLA_20281 [Thraustotheca clavata]|uniref:Uncharacterized protein n=1 Tax=Thraustotheca clavata TaxID=74557 RepID=A0A1W0A9W0_9STRA|nr:hypothetical protein THRCLA_20281 [Thraustotheca clavata]
MIATYVLTNLPLIQPLELLEITQPAESIKIPPNSNEGVELSNIASRFNDTSYLQRFNYLIPLPSHILFINDCYKEPILPLHFSAVENSIKHVKLWIKCKPVWLTPAPLKLAAICGHLEIVKLLMYASKSAWYPEAMDLAAMNGHLDVMRCIRNIENGPGCTTESMDGAATYGHLEVVKFLNENRTEGCTTKALEGAINSGYAKVVEYLMEHRHQQYISDSIFLNSEFYKINCHQSSEEKDYIGTKWSDSNAMDIAASVGDLDTIKLLHRAGIKCCTTQTLDLAAAIGCTDAAMTYAAAGDLDLDVVKWLHEVKTELHQGCFDTYYNFNGPKDESRCGLRRVPHFFVCHRTPKIIRRAVDKAASNGRIEIVQILHDFPVTTAI